MKAHTRFAGIVKCTEEELIGYRVRHAGEELLQSLANDFRWRDASALGGMLQMLVQRSTEPKPSFSIVSDAEVPSW